MKPIAFIFPGQGSQYVGMGKELFENFSMAKQVFEEAEDALGLSLSTLCFNGPEEALQLTENTPRAALITRSLAEMTRLGVALGGRAETFMGLSGLGDLVLTATGDLSRNRSVGLMLAQGLDLTTILERLGHVAEGVTSAPMVLQRARSAGVEMPITEAVVGVLAGHHSPAQALRSLMSREARAE